MDQIPEAGTVVGVHKMGKFVDNDVITHPLGEGGQAAGEADAPQMGGATAKNARLVIYILDAGQAHLTTKVTPIKELGSLPELFIGGQATALGIPL